MRRLGLALAVALVGGGLYAGYVRWRDPTADGPARNAADAPAERVRVQVLNAGGVGGVARSATGALRDAGFDVVQFGNAGSFDRTASVVIDRVGRPDLARLVAMALGVGEVISEPDSNLYVDVTVLLGSEWVPEGDGRDEASDPAPWDPRGWIDR